MEENQNEEPLIKYLLGELSEEGRRRFEESHSDQGQLLIELKMAEDELIDCYVRGELPEDLRESFKKYLASAERAKRVEFARALKLYVQKAAAGQARKTDQRGGLKATGRWFVGLISRLMRRD